MSSYHYNDISSHQIETLEISKELFATNLNIEIVQLGVNFKTVQVCVPLGIPSKVTNKNGLKNRMQSSTGEE
jgi:hypothetical protein